MARKRWIRRLLGSPSGKQIAVGTVLLVIGAAVQPTFKAVGRHLVGDRPPARLGDIARFLGDSERVLKRTDIDLGGSRVPESVVIAVGSPDALGLVPGKLVIVGWDDAARRWTLIFDSSQRQFGYPSGPVLPQDQVDASKLQTIPFSSRPGHRDLAVNANLRDGRQVVIVLTFDEEVIDVAYYNQTSGPGRISLASRGAHRVLQVSASLETIWGPARTYHFEVAFDELNERFQVVADDRPWLGTYLASDDQLGGVIMDTEWSSPAHAGLQSGDVIMGFVGDSDAKYSGADIVQELARRFPGDAFALRVRRGLTERVVTGRLGSLLEASDVVIPPLSEPVLGGRLRSTDHGVEVEDVDLGEGLARSGVKVGDTIVRLGGVRIRRLADLYIALVTADESSPTATVVRKGRARPIKLSFRTVDSDDMSESHDLGTVQRI